MAEVDDAGPLAERGGRVGESGPAVKELLPWAVRPRLREVPVLAWTFAQSYSLLPWPGSRPGTSGAVLRALRTCWPVPLWITLWLPIVALLVQWGHLARRDRHAAVLIMPFGQRPPARAVGAAVLWFVPLIVVVYVVPAWQQSAAPFTQILVLLVCVDLIGLCRRAFRVRGTGRLVRGRARLLLDRGVPVHLVGQYAAHPPRQGHGSALLDELLLAAPDDVWLLAGAASPVLAQRYGRYGFRSWDPKNPLLLERRPSRT